MNIIFLYIYFDSIFKIWLIEKAPKSFDTKELAAQGTRQQLKLPFFINSNSFLGEIPDGSHPRQWPQETTDVMKCPRKISRLDWEVELAVLIPEGNNLLDILAILMY